MAGTPYATDENLAITAKSDWTLLSEPLDRLGYGLDGSVGATAPDAWLFSSPSNDFAAQGVAPGHVIRLPERGRPTAKLGGSPKGLYAVDGVVGPTTLRLRPLGKSSGTGWPPQPPGMLGLEFSLETADAQILDASRSIDMRLRTDPAAPASYPPDVITPDDYRQLAVWVALAVLYRAAWREADVNRDTFLAKSREYAKLADTYFDELMARIMAIFGPAGGAPIVGRLTAGFGRAIGSYGMEPAILNNDGTVTSPGYWPFAGSFWPAGWF